MKKFISAISASILAVSALPVVTASAVSVEENIISVSTETVSETLTVDETVIPAGAIAVTVNIAGNSGFISTTTKLDLGAYDVISNEKGTPVAVTGNTTYDSLVTGSVNEEIAVFTTVGTKEDDTDGSIFTFYVNGNNSAISDITVSDFETVGYADIASSLMSAYSLNNAPGYYKIGDVNNNGYVDSVDATITQMAIGKNNGKKISVADANANLTYYFVENTVCAQSADSNISGTITVADADDMSLYYACMASCIGEENPEQAGLEKYQSKTDGGHCGEIKYYNGK